MTTSHFNTKERILGAAEELFAQHGFAGTSLRQVTSRADVNIAAVNYHFGSKENLVNEVFRRRMDEMSERRLYWRLDFTAGALTYAMSDFGLIKRPAGISEKAHSEKAAQALIRFAAAGLRAPA